MSEFRIFCIGIAVGLCVCAIGDLFLGSAGNGLFKNIGALVVGLHFGVMAVAIFGKRSPA